MGKLKKCKDCKHLTKSCLSRARTGQCKIIMQERPEDNPLVAYNRIACDKFINK